MSGCLLVCLWVPLATIPAHLIRVYRSVNTKVSYSIFIAFQIPPMVNYSMQGRTYRFFEGDPLYLFDYGLTYTTFEYLDLILLVFVDAGQPLTGSVVVANKGKLDADEVRVTLVVHFFFFFFFGVPELSSVRCSPVLGAWSTVLSLIRSLILNVLGCRMAY